MPLTRYLLPFAMESDEALPLVDAAMVWMRQHELIAPPILALERLVWRVQRIASQRIYSRLTQVLSPAQQQALDDLLVVDATKANRTPLAWLRIPAKKPSPESMYHLKRKRWKRHTLTEESINPNYYELAAFDRLQDGLRSGDIAVTGSRRYQAFDDYLLSPQQWQQLKKQDQTRLAVADNPLTYLQDCQRNFDYDRRIAEQIASLMTQVAKELRL